MRRAAEPRPRSLSIALAAISSISIPALAAASSHEQVRLADLPPDVVSAVRAAAAGEPPPSPRELRDRIFAAGKRYRFDVGVVAFETDTRWFGTSPPGDPGSPILEVRRWPGDSVMAFYLLEGEAALSAGPPAPIAGPKLEPKGPEGEMRRWEGTVATPLGGRPGIWLERRVEGFPRRLGALLLPGDAGLGPDGVPVVTEEMLAIVERATLSRDAWRVARGIPATQRVLLPDTGHPPGGGDERRDPWQVVLAEGFSLGLPPGILARRLGPELPPPTPMPGAVLWLRGSVVDRDGTVVVVGDASRAGYVAEVPTPGPGWATGSTPPLLSPSATREDGDRLDPLIAEWTGATQGRVEHFREPGWDGDWLVFRLLFKDRGIEIGLPVVQGWRSLALFWVPFTWRAQGQAPAPPPIDPAERFGIRFIPLSPADRRRNALLEGSLQLPGFRADVPRGWWPVASLRTSDGFPVKLVDKQGRAGLRLTRLSPEAPGFPKTGEGGWALLPRPGAHRAAAVYRHPDGPVVFVAAEGHAYLVEPEPGYALDRLILDRVVESVELTRR